MGLQKPTRGSNPPAQPGCAGLTTPTTSWAKMRATAPGQAGPMRLCWHPGSRQHKKAVTYKRTSDMHVQGAAPRERRTGGFKGAVGGLKCPGEQAIGDGESHHRGPIYSRSEKAQASWGSRVCSFSPVYRQPAHEPADRDALALGGDPTPVCA